MTVKAAYAAANRVERFDADLARQLRRAGSSVPLNISEGSRKGNRVVRYQSAMASANKVRSTLQVAAAVGFVEANVALDDRLDKIIATLWKLTRWRTWMQRGPDSARRFPPPTRSPRESHGKPCPQPPKPSPARQPR